jgi:hypothetical protein
MNARSWSLGALWLLTALPISEASARDLSVEIATDRGHDAVYRNGDPLSITARTSADAYLMVYEIDAEGYVHLLFPDRNSSPFVEGDRTYELPRSDSNLELVVRGPVGQGYIVAIASEQPFLDLPWYLRPYDAQAEEMGYEGGADEEEGVTAEGRIVGDPFVAMERIRRRVLENPEDELSFATAYTSYYVGHAVRYPRYLCNDCHRPGYYSWWTGFDPYYEHCSVFDFRVNWAWVWGRPYWTGHVPHYLFVYRTNCPPRYRVFGSRGVRHSSWDGWRRWRDMWGGPLRRYKHDPPPRTAYDPGRRWPKDRTPPGYLSEAGRRFKGGADRHPAARDRGEGRSERRDVRWRDAAGGLERRPRAGGPRFGVRDPRQRIGAPERRERREDHAGREREGRERRDIRDRGNDRGRARPMREGREDRGANREVRRWRDDPGRTSRPSEDRSEVRDARRWGEDLGRASRRHEDRGGLRDVQPWQDREGAGEQRELRRERRETIPWQPSPRIDSSPRAPSHREQPQAEPPRRSREEFRPARPEPFQRTVRPEPLQRSERKRRD